MATLNYVGIEDAKKRANLQPFTSKLARKVLLQAIFLFLCFSNVDTFSNFEPCPFCTPVLLNLSRKENS